MQLDKSSIFVKLHPDNSWIAPAGVVVPFYQPIESGKRRKFKIAKKVNESNQTTYSIIMSGYDILSNWIKIENEQ